MKNILYCLWLMIINRVMAFTMGALIAIAGLLSPELCIKMIESASGTSNSVDSKK